VVFVDDHELCPEQTCGMVYRRWTQMQQKSLAAAYGFALENPLPTPDENGVFRRRETHWETCPHCGHGNSAFADNNEYCQIQSEVLHSLWYQPDLPYFMPPATQQDRIFLVLARIPREDEESTSYVRVSLNRYGLTPVVIGGAIPSEEELNRLMSLVAQRLSQEGLPEVG